MALRHTPIEMIRLVLVLALVVLFPFFADNYLLNLANTIGVVIVGAVGLNILTGFTGQISLGQGAFMAVGAYTAALLSINWGAPMWLTIPSAAILSRCGVSLEGSPNTPRSPQPICQCKQPVYIMHPRLIHNRIFNPIPHHCKSLHLEKHLNSNLTDKHH